MMENGLSASVAFDSINNKLVITSSTFGSDSTVSVQTENTDLGFDFTTPTYVATGGVDAAGTIDGVAANASGQFLTSDSGNSKDLRISVIGGAIGDRGNIVFSRGIADQLDSLLEQLTDDDGTIESKTTGLNSSLSDVDQAREQLTLRMDSLESRLLAQFTAMDALVSQLNSVGSFLSSTLSNLPGSKSGGN
jgi:flagellar hook-associated protein 2